MINILIDRSGKTSPVDLNDKVIDLTENNSSKEHIFVSNTINACVSGNSIDVESFNNVAVDENIANLYDSILALKNRVEENDRVHEQNERVGAETLRVTAESKRATDTAASLKKIDDTVKGKGECVNEII